MSIGFLDFPELPLLYVTAPIVRKMRFTGFCRLTVFFICVIDIFNKRWVFSYAIFSLPYFLKTVNTAAIAYSMYVGALQTRRCSIFDLG